MSHKNIEIKARCPDSEAVRAVLRSIKADFKGCDYQKDTYFNVPAGRLKLRQGNIENSLIFYNRANSAGPKQSNVSLFHMDKNAPELENTLKAALGVKIEVVKKREIYFKGNVKFHIDSLERLGSFVEIEAIDSAGEFTTEKLRSQCDYYMKLLRAGFKTKSILILRH